MPFAHTHREDFSKKNGVCQLFSRRFTGICRNLSISGKIKPSPCQSCPLFALSLWREKREKIVSRFVASPCLLKIFRCKIFFGKNVKPSLRQASPCFILLNAKFSKNCQPLSEASPRGEAPCKARWWGAQHTMQSPFLIVWIFRKEFLKIKGRSPFFDCLNIFDKKLPKAKGQVQNRTTKKLKWQQQNSIKTLTQQENCFSQNAINIYRLPCN